MVGEGIAYKSLRVCYSCGSNKSTADLRDNSERWYVNPIDGQVSIHQDNITGRFRSEITGKEILWLCYNCYQSLTLSRFAVFGIINEYRCRRCGESDLICLQLDHVNGGGTYLKTKLGGLKNMYRFYIKNPEIAKKELQALCANCNIRKRIEKGEINTKYIPLE